MLSWKQCFDLVMVINLAERQDRRREMIAQLARIGAAPQPGKIEFFNAIRVHQAEGFPAPSVRGCFLSHLGVLKEARRRGVDRLLVMEDDLEVLPENAARLANLADLICNSSWDFLYLGHREPVTAGEHPTLLPYHLGIVTAHLYAVHARVFDPLIDYLESCLRRQPGDPVGGPMHVDGALSMFRAAHPQYTTLLSVPSLAGQRSSRSDISPGRVDRVPLLREAAGLARTLRRSFQIANWS